MGNKTTDDYDYDLLNPYSKFEYYVIYTMI